MVDDAQKARPHKIDGKTVETKRAMPREVCFMAWDYYGKTQEQSMSSLTRPSSPVGCQHWF